MMMRLFFADDATTATSWLLLSAIAWLESGIDSETCSEFRTCEYFGQWKGEKQSKCYRVHPNKYDPIATTLSLMIMISDHCVFACMWESFIAPIFIPDIRRTYKCKIYARDVKDLQIDRRNETKNASTYEIHSILCIIFITDSIYSTELDILLRSRLVSSVELVVHDGSIWLANELYQLYSYIYIYIITFITYAYYTVLI